MLQMSFRKTLLSRTKIWGALIVSLTCCFASSISADNTAPDKTMITAIVTFPLAKGTSSADAKALFEASASNYKNFPGLIRKYYLYGDGPLGGGVYLWESRAAADKLYTTEWRKTFEERLGAAPKILFFESPVIVDNDQH